MPWLSRAMYHFSLLQPCGPLWWPPPLSAGNNKSGEWKNKREKEKCWLQQQPFCYTLFMWSPHYQPSSLFLFLAQGARSCAAQSVKEGGKKKDLSDFSNRSSHIADSRSPRMLFLRKGSGQWKSKKK
jgi:hypothetical protein